MLVATEMETIYLNTVYFGNTFRKEWFPFEELIGFHLVIPSRYFLDKIRSKQDSSHPYKYIKNKNMYMLKSNIEMIYYVAFKKMYKSKIKIIKSILEELYFFESC